MGQATLGLIHRQLGRLFGEGTVAGLGESELLRRFAERGDELAFAAIVERHGPMVLAACRRALADPNDVDDAFQATFLVLVRRARSIRDADRLGPWLFGVARRVARRASRLSGRESTLDRLSDLPARPDPEPDDLGPLLHAELERLPAIYREVVLLCDLEGCTHAEAAARLRCPVGTVKGRLSRARNRLRDRLARRGLDPAAAAVAISVTLGAESRAVVAHSLVDSTVRAAVGFAAGNSLAAAGVAPASLALASGVHQAMILNKLTAIGGAAMLGTLATVAAASQFGTPIANHGGSTPPAAAQHGVESPDPTAGQSKDNSITPEHGNNDASTLAGTPQRREGEKFLSADAAAAKAVRTAELELEAASRTLLLRKYERVALSLLSGSRNEQEKQAQEASLTILRFDRDHASSGDPLERALSDHLARMTDLCDRMHERLGEVDGAPKLAPEANSVIQRLHLNMAQAEFWLAQHRAGESPTIEGGASLMTFPPDLENETVAILRALEQPISMPFEAGAPLEDFIKYFRMGTDSEKLPGGIPVYVHPASLEAVEKTMQSPVSINLEGVKLKTTLRLALQQLGLNYIVKEGLLIVGSSQDDWFLDEAGMQSTPGGGVAGYGFVPKGGFSPTGGAFGESKGRDRGFGGGVVGKQ